MATKKVNMTAQELVDKIFLALQAKKSIMILDNMEMIRIKKERKKKNGNRDKRRR